ncbi:MAG: alpha-mannosidase [Bacteroidales bacterium]|nr:alpha-mannosidase [Bacteroidales bacterium]
MKKIILFVFTVLFAAAAAGAQEKKGEIYMASNAHLDTQWLWTVQQVIGEYLPNTLYQNFKLLEDYPDYKFTLEGAVKYQWFKEYYPDAYAKLKEYVAEGRWYPAGGWDANDYNVPSVESNIRNILLGEEFYKKEFGQKSIDIMLPDCFGFGYTLPTVAAHCGLYAFHTQKLQWRKKPFYEGNRKWPFEFGIWQGVDGSRILAAMNGGEYGFNPREDISDNDELKAKVGGSAVNAVMRYYGTRSSRHGGDQGGSPLPIAVRTINESIKKGGPAYNLRFATVADIFRDHKDLLSKDVLPVHDGELLMDVHGTGVYTANSNNKQLNRRAEQLGYAAEASAVIADWLGAVPYPSYVLNEAYRRFIWHQFHDDLTGTSIKEVYPFSWNDIMLSQNQFAATVESSAEGIGSAMDTRTKGTPVLVFNPVSAANNDIVTVEFEMPDGCKDVQVYGPDGKRVKSQVLEISDGKACIAVAVASKSVSLGVYDFRPVKTVSKQKTVLKADGNTIENAIYKLTVDANGDICSIIDKRCDQELVAEGEAFGLQVFENNVSNDWPAWEIIKDVIDQNPLLVGEDVNISVESAGPLMAVLKVERRFKESKFTQRIILYDGAADDRIDIENNVDWQCKRSLLKAGFPMSFGAARASYDLGLGYIQRENNTDIQYEVPAQEWADITAEDGSYGVTVMSDSRYGWDKPCDNTIRLTLLHTPSADRGFSHESTLDIGPHTFTYSIVGHPGALDGAKATTAADLLNQRKSAFVTTRHAGSLGQEFSMVSTDNPSIRVKALKNAEDGDGIIVRVYELSGNKASGNVTFAGNIVSAEETNGIEERIGPASFAGRNLHVEAGRFAPKTYRVRLAAPAVKVAAPELRTIALPYNKVAISSNGFSAFGHMDKAWHSYAAEQIPEEILYGGVTFRPGEADYDNAVACDGQTLALPAGTRGVYLLAAASEGDKEAVFHCGSDVSVSIPCWTGFFGSGYWEPYQAFLKEGDVAYVGSHRHDSSKRDEIYVETYMYMVYIPVPDGVTELVLPKDKEITIFAAEARMTPRSEAREITNSVTRL